VYAQLCLDSQKKWRADHIGSLREWRQHHPDAVEQNGRQQQPRDDKRRVRRLAKALLREKNNLASSQIFIFQPFAGSASPRPLA
jgi:hypothetical protein